MKMRSVLWLAGMVLSAGLLGACQDNGDTMYDRTGPDWGSDGNSQRDAAGKMKADPGGPGDQGGSGSGGAGGGMARPGGG